MKRAPTAYERDLKRDLRNPAFRRDFEHARERIDVIDTIIRELDERREELGLSKAKLAQLLGANEAAIRRFFTAPSPNPTITTLVGVAHALGREIILRPRHSRTLRGTRSRNSRASARTKA